MRIGQIALVVVLVLSLVANGLLINELLEKKFYQLGVQNGAKQITNKIVQEVQVNGRLNVQLPNGRKMILEPIPSRQQPPVSSAPEKVKVEPIPPAPASPDASRGGGKEE